MTIYLTIITTVLVATQIIRITQNHFQLKRQGMMIDKELAHLKTYGDIDGYVELQRECFMLLYDKLKSEARPEMPDSDI